MNRPPLSDVASAGMPAVREMSGQWLAFMGINQSQGVQVMSAIGDFGRAPADEAWVYRCVALKASFAAGVPLRTYVKAGRERIPAEDTRDAAAQDLGALLEEVNPVNMNGGDLKAFSTAAMSVWGENFVQKVRGRHGGRPKELYWHRAPDMAEQMGRIGVDAWKYRTGPDTEIIPSRDMIMWKTINLQNPVRGLSPLSAARYAIAVNRQADEHMANLLANWSVPPGAWVIPKDVDFTPQDRSLVQRTLRMLRGPRNAGKVPVLPQGLTWQSISMTPADMESVHARKLSRMQICSVLGVPLVLAGDDEKTTVYANMRDAERIFARFMIGELDTQADGYNGWLVPDFDPVNRSRRHIEVAFDYSQIEALQAPLEDRQQVSLSEIEHGARTPDEYRAQYRIGGPLPNGEGKTITRLSTLVPLGIGPEAPPADYTAVPQQTLSDDGSDTIRAFGRHLYAHPAVKSWIADPSTSLNANALLGHNVRPAARAVLEDGIRRRNTAAVIAETLQGVMP